MKTGDARPAISLFSGAGGMDVGFKDAGFQVLMANDIDPDACETYRRNHEDVILDGSLHDLLPLTKRFTGIDLVFGGPPCQGFSVAGKMDPSDERSTLVGTFFDVVACVKPRVFVCENVKALAVLNRWANFRAGMFERARELGYKAVLLVLNSSDFGVPQGRERMFFIGFSEEVFAEDEKALSNALVSNLAMLRQSPPTIREVIRAFGPAGSVGNERICRATITFAKKPVLRRSPYAGMLFNGAGRPLSAGGHSSTLPASMGGNKTPIIDEHVIFEGGNRSFVEEYHAHLMKGGKPYIGKAPSQLRRLTVDECLAIQTFPSDYNLGGSQSAMYRQIGNAVPCKLAEAVATAVKRILDCGCEPSRAYEMSIQKFAAE